MANGKKNLSLFALLFSDLMMGAMAIIVVLLVFLQVVTIRGGGTHQSVQALELPPGLDMDTLPVVRIRVEYCSSDKGDVQLEWSGQNDKVIKFGMQQSNNGVTCNYRIFHFEDGLGGKMIELKTNGDVRNAVETNILVTIAGFPILQPHSFLVDTSTPQTIAFVDLNRNEGERIYAD